MQHDHYRIVGSTDHHRIVGSVSFTAQADMVMNAIRRRAHDLWEAEGRPPDRDFEFWHKAEAEVMDRVAARRI
jgi:hypothetical protein